MDLDNMIVLWVHDCGPKPNCQMQPNIRPLQSYPIFQVRSFWVICKQDHLHPLLWLIWYFDLK